MKKHLGILVFILLLGFNLLGQQQNESVFNIPVSVSLTDKPLAEVLNEISKSANVYFSYDASIVVTDRLVSVNVKDRPIISVLNSLFDNSLFYFIEKENQIIISLVENEPEKEVIRDTVNSESVVLQGQLIDDEKGYPLQYASISVFNKPIGTITNTEGEYILKLKQDLVECPIVLSCLGYSQKLMTVKELLKTRIVTLHPVFIEIKEVKVTAFTPEEILNQVVERLPENYGNELIMMKGFYRETLMQDNVYINVSEAVLDILKSQYYNTSREDKVRIVKGRKSPDVSPFQWVNFKLMGGPYTITKLDVLKTMDSFINPEFRSLYRYNIDRIIWFHGHPVYVLAFRPIKNTAFICFQGEMYIDRETFALLHVDFGFSKQGLRIADQSLIRKKTRGLKVRAINVDYRVDYRYSNGMCYFNSAKASMIFRVKNRAEDVNSQFNSVSELLVTDLEKSQVKRFPKNQVFNESDIFTENIKIFDEEFWGNFNILKPDEDLRSAIENSKIMNQSIDNHQNYNKNFLTNSISKE